MRLRLSSWAWLTTGTVVVACVGLTTLGCSGKSGSRSFSSTTTAPTTSSTPAGTTSSQPANPTTGTTTPGTTPIVPGVPGVPTQPPPGAWYKGDLHSHSATHSDDARRQMGDPTAVTVRVAEAMGLDFLAGTDHRTNDLLTDPNFTSQTMVLLHGMEWGGSMHAGAIGLTAPIQPNITTSGAALKPELDQIIAEIHRQGGVFVLNHPTNEGKLWVVDPTRFDAIEVWNSQWSMAQWDPQPQSELDDQMRGLGLTQAGIPANPHMVAAIADQRGTASLQALTFWESYLNSGRRVAVVGGGDRHMLMPQGSPTTHVFAATRDRQGILNGIRQGRTFVSRTPAGPLVSFAADQDGDGTFESIIGDEVASGRSMTFRIVVEGAVGGRVDLVKRGVVIRSEPVLASTHVVLTVDAPAPGDWYRVDVYELINPHVQNTYGSVLGLAHASGQSWAPLLALAGMLPRSALDGTLGTILPTLRIPDDVDRLLHTSRKDPGYCRGAITSAIYVR